MQWIDERCLLFLTFLFLGFRKELGNGMDVEDSAGLELWILSESREQVEEEQRRWQLRTYNWLRGTVFGRLSQTARDLGLVLGV